MRLDQATRIMLGDREVSRVYLGANMVWGNSFSPASLFAQGEPGVWYDPSDMTTLFQDAAGTTPVTAVEQPVGLMLDKSGRGNHAYQPTATSRPVLSARVNLLTKTEQFDDAVWVKVASSFSANKLIPNTTSAVHGVTQNVADITDRSLYVEAKADGYSLLAIGSVLSTGPNITVNLLTGSIVRTAGYGIASSVTVLPDGYCAIRMTVSQASRYDYGLFVAYPKGVGDPSIAWVADGISGVLIRTPSHGHTSQTSLPYQRVNTATDYDTMGFPHYLRFDGVDDWLVTNTITPGTDKVQAFAGVRKLSDAVPGMLAEMSVSATSNAGAFYFAAPEGLNNRYLSIARGTAAASATQAASTGAGVGVAPDTAIISITHDIPGDISTIRRNGIVGTNGAGDKGTGNFLAYPLYIGRRGGTEFPFNGHLYSLIVRFGANPPAATIENTENYINTKTMAY